MTDVHGIPRVYGMIVIIFGLVFFFPLVGFMTELIQSFTDAGGWSVLMLGMTIVALVASILMIGFGANIVWYHDKEDDDVTLEEKAEKSNFKPTEGEKD